MRTYLSIICMLVLALMIAAPHPLRADLPLPQNGAAGKPINVLFVMSGGQTVDPELAKRLTASGYNWQSVSDTEPLALDTLRQFHTVVLVGLDGYNGGEYYAPGGSLLANTEKDVVVLRQYVEAGGGLVLVPLMTGQEASSTYGELLAPWKMRIPAETVHDDSHLVPGTANSWTHNITAHATTAGVHALLYPTNIMRWDDFYPSEPLIPEDPAWTVVAKGESTSQGMYSPGGGKWSAGQAGTAPALAAVREVGSGRVAVLGLGTYYLVTQAFSKSANVGESSTGVIDGKFYETGDGTTRSDWGILFDNSIRWTAQAAIKAGFGGPAAKIPPARKYPIWSAMPDTPVPDWAVLNWKTMVPLTTWSTHTANPIMWRSRYFFDMIPDPRVVAPQKMNKVLIGAHSAYSDGKGSVAEWAAAAKAAGFTALVFTERFDAFTPANWLKFTRECQDQSTPDFACLQGLDISDTFGNRFLLMGNDNFPAPAILTADGKTLKESERLSLGFARHMVAFHRPGSSPLDPQLARHFQAISVYTYGYDEQGRFGIQDDGFSAYHWQLKNASNPVPIVVHELSDPTQIAKDGTTGYQVVVPSSDALDTIRYFRSGLGHFFENPQRYYITEGPIIDNWSLANSDVEAPELNRDHFRMAVGASSPDPSVTIDDAILYDRDSIARHWTPHTANFKEMVDGEHGYQRYFMLVVTDSKGHKAISPQLRTVTEGCFTRCADRQNWFGAALPYSGIWAGIDSINFFQPSFPAPGTSENLNPYGNSVAGQDMADKMQFTFASNAVSFSDMLVDERYRERTSYGMDAWRLIDTLPSRTYEISARVAKWHDIHPVIDSGNKGYDKMVSELTAVDAVLRSRQAVQPQRELFPIIQHVPADSTYIYRKGGAVIEGKLDGTRTTLLDLPAGASISNLLLLEPLTVSGAGELGWRADTSKLIPRTTEWHAAYMYIPRTWRPGLGADGATPWSMHLSQGAQTSTLGTVNVQAADYGVAGKIHAAGDVKILPVVVSGLNDNWPAACWTPGKHLFGHDANLAAVPRMMSAVPPTPGTQSGGTFLNHIGVFEGLGYASLDATDDTPFYIGNTLMASDKRLILAHTWWTKQDAGIEVNNPTAEAITAKITSPAAIADYYPISTTVTVPAGTTVRVSLPETQRQASK